MSGLRSAFRIVNRNARLGSGSSSGSNLNLNSRPTTLVVIASSRRGFRWTACRKEQVLDADKMTFEKAISKEKTKGRVVLVDFYAETRNERSWCGPCKMLSPILMKLTAPGSDSAAAAGVKTQSGRSVDLVTVNTDEQGDLAIQYKVRALPTVIAFVDGKPEQKFVGALNEQGVRDFLSKL